MRHVRSNARGFTLIEILIVVVILGILAAVAVPQFTTASTDARRSSVRSTVQTLRGQVALYKLQHGDALPDLLTDWSQFLLKTDLAGSTSPAAGVQTFGPYMQSTPVNGLNDSSLVLNGDGTAAAGTFCGFVYDYSAGAGSGRVWGTDSDGVTLLP